MLETLTDQQLHTLFYLHRQDVLDINEDWSLILWGWDRVADKDVLLEHKLPYEHLGLAYAAYQRDGEDKLHLFIKGESDPLSESFFYWECPPSREALLVAADLLRDGPLFLSSYNSDLKTWDEGIYPCLNVNDIFAPAADAEKVEWSDVPMLWELHRDKGWRGIVKWVAVKRNSEPYLWHPTRRKEWLEQHGGD
jgi:hypothetical protein